MKRTSTQAGFSIVESLIGLAVATVIGSAFLSLIMAQDRFYGRLDSGVGAQQNLRAAADLVSTEVRMAGPDDMLAAQSDSVSLRFDVYHAVVCDVTGGNTVAIIVYDSAPNPNISTGLTGTAYSQPYQTTYEYADGWMGSSTAATGAKTTCTGNGAPTTFASSAYRYVSGWTGNFTSGVPPRGATVRRYRQLTYRFAPSGMGSGTALYRGSQELISPLDVTSSISYQMADGTVRTNVVLADLPDIRVVKLNVVATDDDPRFDLQRTVTLDIPLRN